MKQNLHFEDDNSRAFGRLVLGIFAILMTVGGLLVGTQIYGEWQRQRRISENDEAISERLVRIAQCQEIIRQLGNGKSDAVRQQFSIAMAQEISKIRSTLGEAGPDQQEFAKHVLSVIAQDEINHPDDYRIPGRTGTGQPGTSNSPVLQPITQGAPSFDGGGQN